MKLFISSLSQEFCRSLCTNRPKMLYLNALLGKNELDRERGRYNLRMTRVLRGPCQSLWRLGPYFFFHGLYVTDAHIFSLCKKTRCNNSTPCEGRNRWVKSPPMCEAKWGTKHLLRYIARRCVRLVGEGVMKTVKVNFFNAREKIDVSKW